MTVGSGLWSRMRAAAPHLLGSGGLAGEIADLRNDLLDTLSPMAGIAVEEYTDLVGLAAPGAAALKAATATVASIVTVLPAGLLAAGLAQLAAWPRPLTFTTAGGTAADAPANVVITGTDMNGAAISETLALAQTATVVTSVNAYKTIVSLVYPAADGTGATIAVGIGAAYIKKATATVASAATLAGSTLIQTDLANVPRYIVFTTAGGTAADAPATATIVGKDIAGRVVTEVVTLAQTAATATSKNAFASISSISYPAADGTGATIAISFSAAVGLRKKIKTRAGLTGAIREIMDGSAPTAGTFTAPSTTDLPYGSYAPNTAANDAHDYAIYYEYDDTAA